MGPKESGKSVSNTITPRIGRELLDLARLAVRAVFEGEREPVDPIPKDVALEEPGAVFVTLRDEDGQLRGCIGTLSPKFPTVAEETWCMAREAAFSDSRFQPVRAQELPRLRFEVSLLGPLEEVTDLAALDPRRFGIVVSAPDGRRGALLPNVEGVGTVESQVSIARRKGGILPAEPIQIRRFETWHFVEE